MSIRVLNREWLKLRQRIGRWRRVLVIALSVAGLVVAINLTGAFQMLEWAALDQFFCLRPREATDSRIVIVTIDESDLKYVGRSQIPDTDLAKLLKKLKAQQPRFIGLDLYRDLPVEPGAQELVRVFQSTPNLIGVEKAVNSTVAPPPTLSKLGQVALADVVLDADGKVRRGLLSIKPRNGKTRLTLGAELALKYLEGESIRPRTINASKQYVGLGKAVFVPFSGSDGSYVRADAGGYQILLNFRGTQVNFRTVSFTQVLENQIAPDLMRDRIVLIGAIGESLNDLFFTPYSSTFFSSPKRMPGVVIHANLTSQMISAALNGRPLIQTWTEPVEWLWILGWSCLGATVRRRLLQRNLLTKNLSPRWTALVIYIVPAGGILLASSYLAFLASWWIPVVSPLVAFTGSAIAIAGYYSQELRKQSEQAIRESEQQYRSIFENALEGIFQSTLDGRYLSVNPALARIYGYDSPEELIATLTDIQHQLYVDPQRRTEFLRLMQQQGAVSKFESQVYCKDGRIVWIIENARTVCDANGRLLYYQGFAEDITERKHAEAERLKFMNELFELNQAFSRFVPRQFLQLLDKQSVVDVQLGDQVQQEMSILFADIRDFTTLSESLTPQENFKFINAYLSRMEPAIRENNGFIDKYIGDAIMALFGGCADDAVRAGIAMLRRLAEYNQHRLQQGDIPIRIGIGINTGSMMLGTVGGLSRMDSTVISDAVNLAARVEELTKDYGVSLLISHHTFRELRHPVEYAFRVIERVKLKGKSQMVSVFEIFDADPPQIREGKLATKAIFEQALSLYHRHFFQEAAQLFQECLHVTSSDETARIYLKRCQQGENR